MPRCPVVPFRDRTAVLDILADHGVGQVVFTGGEPLLDPDLPALLEYAQRSSKTWLFTNCLLLEQLASEVLAYTDRLSISLDGPTEEINALARKPGHFATVLSALHCVTERYPRIKTQVITVVTRVNRWHLMDIGRVLLKNKGTLDFRWKLNHCRPIGRTNRRFLLSYAYFKRIAAKVARSFAGELEVRYSVPEHDYGYLFIMPHGQMYTTVADGYVRISTVQKAGTYGRKTLKTLALIRDNLAERENQIAKQAELQK